MKKVKIVSVILILATSFSLMTPIYVQATEQTHPAFDDVSTESYYYDAIDYMYKEGYVYGYGNHKFGPRNNITLAEVLTLLYRINDFVFSNTGEYWYSEVFDDALYNEYIPEDSEPSKIVTRYEIAEYIISIFKLNPEIQIDNAFVDINDDVVNTMFQYGIFQGIDTENGFVFASESYITRGDLCLVLQRLIGYLEEENVFFIGDYRIKNNPTSELDFREVICAIAHSENFIGDIIYDVNIISPTQFSNIKKQIKSAFEKEFMSHPEYMSFTPNMDVVKSYSENSDKWLLTIKLKNDSLTDEELLNARDVFNKECIDYITLLENNGKISHEFQDIENIKNIFDFVIYCVKYDSDYSVYSFCGYGASHNEKAVCQGYTAFFNQLCQLYGYKTDGVTGYVIGIPDSHMWSRISIDNSILYFDTTFADLDSMDYIDYDFFNMTKDMLKKDRIILFEDSSIRVISCCKNCAINM